MKTAVLVAALALAGCTTVETYPVPPRILTPEQRSRIAAGHDAAFILTNRCDAMFPRYGDAHRLCMLRGIDRLETQPLPPLVTAPDTAPIQILPYPYPPLAPSTAVPVVPVVPGTGTYGNVYR